MGITFSLLYTITTSVVVVGLLTACSVAGTSGGERVSFTTIDRGSQSGVREPRSLVIRDERNWRELWRTHSAPVRPVKPVPTIDFSQEMLVAVFAGEKPTGGYRIEITAIEDDPAKQQLRVSYREIKPPPGAMVTQALTQPYHIVRLKRVDLPPMFASESLKTRK